MLVFMYMYFCTPLYENQREKSLCNNLGGVGLQHTSFILSTHVMFN